MNHKPIVVVESLQVRYKNGALGIADVSLNIGSGQVVGLVGPNGAGKTTTVRAISGFLRSEGARITSGTVSLFGANTTNKEPHVSARLGAAFVPERQKIFPNISVSENLIAINQVPPRLQRRKLEEMIWSIFPMLKEHRRTAAGRLSGGQQQMLAIARALMTQPKLLIVDEITLGLHYSMHEPLYHAVREIASTGTSVLLVDESTKFILDVAEYCYLVNGGKNIVEGPTTDFEESGALAAGYVGAAG